MKIIKNFKNIIKSKKFIVLVILIAVSVGGWYYYEHAKASKLPLYITQDIEIGDIVQKVSTTGTLEAVNTVEVGTQVSGTISKVYVDYNSPVKKGQLLALIDPATLKEDLTRAQGDLSAALAALEAARANLRAAQAEGENALRILKREEELYASDFVSKNAVDDAKTLYATYGAGAQSRAAAVRQNEASVGNARAMLRKAANNLGYTRIISPIDGTVIRKSISEGQTVAASLQAPVLFTLAEDLTRMQVAADVDEADIGMVKEGTAADFTVDAYPEEKFSGKIKQVRLAAAKKENVVTYTVIILVDNKDMKLMPSMTANVAIKVAQVSGALVIPQAAMRFRMESAPQGGGQPQGQPGEQKTQRKSRKGPSIWILKDNAPQQVEVEVLLSDGANAAISSDILKENDKVITAIAAEQKKNGVSPPRMF